MLILASSLWILVFFLFHKKLQPLFSYFHTHDLKRLGELEQKLHENFIFREKQKIQKWSYIFLTVGLSFALVYRSMFILSFVLIGFLVFPIVWIRTIEIVRAKKFQNQLLIFVPSLSSMLKSGHGLERALRQLKKTSAPPMSDEIGYLLREMQVGVPMEDAFLRLADRFRSENMLILVHSISISRKLGTSLSEIIDHISSNILEKEKLRQKILSLTAQGKMQAWVAVAMPLFVSLAIKIISPGYFDPILHSTMGHLCLVYCLISMSLGLFWIYKITHKEYL